MVVWMSQCPKRTKEIYFFIKFIDSNSSCFFGIVTNCTKGQGIINIIEVEISFTNLEETTSEKAENSVFSEVFLPDFRKRVIISRFDSEKNIGN